MARLPDWLRDKLASPPQSGSGVHGWLFSMARQLHVHMDEEACCARLAKAVEGCGREVPMREIRNAVANSMAVAWTRGGKPAQIAPRAEVAGEPKPERVGWPQVDAIARRAHAHDVSERVGVDGLCELWQRSPVRPDDMEADDFLDALFPGAEWLCLAVDHPATARSRRRSDWTFGAADTCGLLVPSPMTGPSGIGLDGKRTHRCLGNTGPRRWLVIEWDRSEGVNIPIDEQARLHWHLNEEALAVGDWPKLKLVLSSAGKSLHGWYGPVESEDKAHELMAYAVSLGADPATWVRCQLVRLPEGARALKTPPVAISEPWETETPAMARQCVYYFDPS